ncbi:hypothetical protein CHU98_g10075 [Xylaria longipes]|nr:hypothetical protein CHU98_g10075 [Xylaria longipes]
MLLYEENGGPGAERPLKSAMQLQVGGEVGRHSPDGGWILDIWAESGLGVTMRQHNRRDVQSVRLNIPARYAVAGLSTWALDETTRGYGHTTYNTVCIASNGSARRCSMILHSTYVSPRHIPADKSTVSYHGLDGFNGVARPVWYLAGLPLQRYLYASNIMRLGRYSSYKLRTRAYLGAVQAACPTAFIRLYNQTSPEAQKPKKIVEDSELSNRKAAGRELSPLPRHFHFYPLFSSVETRARTTMGTDHGFSWICL